MLNHTENKVLSEQIKNNLTKIVLVEQNILKSKKLRNRSGDMKSSMMKQIKDLKLSNTNMKNILIKKFDCGVSK